MNAVAVVTGAGQGIGRAVARRLSADGFAVALVDLDAAVLADGVRELEQRDAQAMPVRTDLTQIDNVADAINQVVQR